MEDLSGKWNYGIRRSKLGDADRMYKVIRGLDEIDWTKSPILRTNIDFTGSAQGMRGNRLRLQREAFKSSARD